MPTAPQWRLCLLLSIDLCKTPWRDVLARALDGGADCIQVREKEMSTERLLNHAREVVQAVHTRGFSVIINDRIDIALASNADGVHLGVNDAPITEACDLAGGRLIIGASTHDLEEAAAAIAAGADYCGVGMMFPSRLKSDLSPSGPDYLRRFVHRYPETPHLAIGGITPSNVGELVHAGARGVAVSTAICSADDPAMATRRIMASLKQDAP